MDLRAALLAGLLAGVTMALPVMVARGLHVGARLDMPRMWGSLAGGSRRAVPLGLAAHLLLSILVGVAYAGGLAVVGAEDRLLSWGFVGGLVHWLVAGTALRGLSVLHPAVPGQLPEPGFFATSLGPADATVFLAAHLTYGTAFGVAYALLSAARL